MNARTCIRTRARARRLLLCALVCLAASLLLPTVNMRIMGPPHTSAGWEALWLSLIAGLMGFASLFEAPGDAARLLLPFFAALSNLNFLGTGIWLYRRRPPRRLPRWLSRAAPCGLILAIVSPLALFKDARLLPGFYVWVLAQGFLLAAVWTAWKGARTAPGNTEEPCTNESSAPPS